jgi:sporulation protein YlmC with PRC-barrel domain
MPEATGHPAARYTIIAKQSVFGAQIINVQREYLGRIEDLIIDTWNSRIAYAILSFCAAPGTADKNFAIPWHALRFDLAEKVAILNIHKDRLNNAPGFDVGDWPDMIDRRWGKRLRNQQGDKPHCGGEVVKTNFPSALTVIEQRSTYYKPLKSNFACFGIFLPSDSAGIESEAVNRR